MLSYLCYEDTVTLLQNTPLCKRLISRTETTSTYCTNIRRSPNTRCVCQTCCFHTKILALAKNGLTQRNKLRWRHDLRNILHICHCMVGRLQCLVLTVRRVLMSDASPIYYTSSASSRSLSSRVGTGLVVVFTVSSFGVGASASS